MRSDNLIVIGASAGGVETLQLLAARAAGRDRRAGPGRAAHRQPSQHPARPAHPARAASRRACAGPGNAAARPHVRGTARPPHAREGRRGAPHRGPKEHHTRPAIDPLFLSAALSHGPGVVGVVLSGWGEDGIAGLQAIKKAGGIAVAQDPHDALHPSMPLSAVKHVQLDHCVAIAAMGTLLESLAKRRAPPPHGRRAPEPLHHEHELALAIGDPLEHLTAIAEPSTFSCPECEGSLWEIGGTKPPRYRCHTGHAYTLGTLREGQEATTDSALWSAVRAPQEKAMLTERAATAHRVGGDEEEAMRHDAAAKEAFRLAEELRRFVGGEETA